MRPAATDTPEAGASFRARVAGVPSGGSLLANQGCGGRLLVRLAGVDAPAPSQPWGGRARRQLGRLVGTSEVAVTCTRVLSPGRIRGLVSLAGTDCGLVMVSRGLARVREEELPPAVRETYRRAGLAARAGREGLWLDPRPVLPSVWRRGELRPRGGRA